jgi:hypothetical protein
MLAGIIKPAINRMEYIKQSSWASFLGLNMKGWTKVSLKKLSSAYSLMLLR